jgi:antitoxin component YwqK of YwqJK toxin-antitoxin module
MPGRPQTNATRATKGRLTSCCFAVATLLVIVVFTSAACTATGTWLNESSLSPTYVQKNGNLRTAEAVWYDGTILRWTEAKLDGEVWLRHGMAYTYAADGKRIIEEASYAEGKRHGPYRSYFGTGQLSVNGEYWHGRKWGFWTEYWENGGLLQRGFWDGEQVGVVRTWYSNGQLHTEGACAIGKYGTSVRVGWWSTYHSNGVLEMEGAYAANGEGKRGQWKLWHENGNLAATGSYSQDASTRLYPSTASDGDWSFWHPSGQMAARGRYAAGARIGDWKFWSRSGQPIDEKTYLAEYNLGLLYVGKHANGQD